MSNIVIALLVSVGTGAWVYSKILRSTGNDTRSALIVAGISSSVLFVALLITLNAIY